MSTVPFEDAESFSSNAAHVEAELARLDLLLAAHLDRRWTEEEPDALGGLHVSEAEIARHLAGNGTDETDSRSVAVDHATRRLRSRTARTVAAGRHLRLAGLAERLSLDRRELDALVVALAPAINRKYGRVYAYLHDDPTRTRPTVGLVGDLAGGDPTTRHIPFSPESPLVDWEIIRVAGDHDDPLAERPLAVPDRVVDHLLGNDVFPDGVDRRLCVEEPTIGFGELPVDEPQRVQMERLADQTRRADRSGGVRHPLVVLDGPYGTGRMDAVAAVCAAVDRPVLTVDCSRGGLDAATLRTVRLEAFLRGAAVHLRAFDAEKEDEHDLRRLLSALDDLPGPVFLTVPEALPAKPLAVVTAHATVTCSFPRPSFDRRQTYWAGLAALPPDADPAALASTFRLAPGAVDDAMATARRLARSAGEPLAVRHVYAGARAQTNGTLGRLAERIEPRYGWDDIVLPADTMAHLREAAAHLRWGGTVYDDWGFAERFAAGTGLTALFAGPSGTGKTMAAEVIAGDAGLDLYRVDLSTVVDKYIGETEKNLGRVFDAAADTDAVLLFDEADALFGSRSAVADAHDRYANVEVSYLLQRIEAHDGPVVLTTNLKGNVDEAFLRRITVCIDFRRPDSTARTAIWRLVFPDETPVEDLDVEYLAGFELTGGNIENVARAAAFLTADDSAAEAVEMRHVVRAIRRELQKSGRLTTPDDFAAYRDLL